MLKFVDSKVTFSEVPDRINLCLSISGCKNKCPGCHSSYLAEDTGEILDKEALKILLDANKGVNCLVFLGGGHAPDELNILAAFARNNYRVEIALYTGYDVMPMINPWLFDYVKVGRYIKELGALDSPTTNQKMYKLKHGKDLVFEDITYKFQNK